MGQKVWMHVKKFGVLRASLVAQRLKHLPAMWETWVRSLGGENPLEKEMATHSGTQGWSPSEWTGWISLQSKSTVSSGWGLGAPSPIPQTLPSGTTDGLPPHSFRDTRVSGRQALWSLYSARHQTEDGFSHQDKTSRQSVYEFLKLHKW